MTAKEFTDATNAIQESIEDLSQEHGFRPSGALEDATRDLLDFTVYAVMVERLFTGYVSSENAKLTSDLSKVDPRDSAGVAGIQAEMRVLSTMNGVPRPFVLLLEAASRKLEVEAYDLVVAATQKRTRRNLGDI